MNIGFVEKRAALEMASGDCITFLLRTWIGSIACLLSRMRAGVGYCESALRSTSVCPVLTMACAAGAEAPWKGGRSRLRNRQMEVFRPGEPWLDNNGVLIQVNLWLPNGVPPRAVRNSPTLHILRYFACCTLCIA